MNITDEEIRQALSSMERRMQDEERSARLARLIVIGLLWAAAAAGVIAVFVVRV